MIKLNCGNTQIIIYYILNLKLFNKLLRFIIFSKAYKKFS
jgi:hypothetical protein